MSSSLIPHCIWEPFQTVNSAFEMGGKNKEKGGRSAQEPPEQLYRFFSKADTPQLWNVQNSFKHTRDFPTL